MVKLQLLNAGPKEISLIQHLADKIWRAHYPSIIGMEQVDYMLNRFYSEESMLEQMHLGQQFFLVELDNERVGFLAVSLVNEKEYFLNKQQLMQLKKEKNQKRIKDSKKAHRS